MDIKFFFKKFLNLLFFFFLCISYSHAVVISDSSVTLTLDWDSLDRLVVWNTDNYKNNGADANLDGVTDSNYQSEGGWVGDPTLTYTAQVTTDAIGSAFTTIDSANATAHTRADGIGISTPPDENVTASGTSHRGKVFSPISDGLLTISFNYIITQTFVSDILEETFSSWSIAELILKNGSTQIGYDQFILNNSGTTEQGSLQISLELLASEYYYLEGHVYTSSSANSPEQQSSGIPEPATLVLMSLGLAAIGYSRKAK